MCLPEKLEKQKLFIVLPYSNNKVEEFGRQMETSITTYFPKVEFKVAFTTPNEIGKYFLFKDRSREIEKQSSVVYRIKCQTCDAVYIGKTKRLVSDRISKHKSNALTNKSATEGKFQTQSEGNVAHLGAKTSFKHSAS